MSIKLNYHTFKILRKKRLEHQHGYDLKRLKKDLKEKISDDKTCGYLPKASGIYIYFRTVNGGG
jgi:hypothetical protein